MRVVVTGALGHIGSRLIGALPTSFPGSEIVLVDDLSTQRYPSLFDLPEDGRYRFVEIEGGGHFIVDQFPDYIAQLREY